mgnify:CR=1 FL=1
MHYDAIENHHSLRHDPFKALVTPRPIGWISSLSPDGILNLAPYSFFNAVSDSPHYIMFVSSGRKNSIDNVEATGEFTCSLSTWDTRDGMNISSAAVPADTDEFQLSGLETWPSNFVAPPRVKAAPAALECKFWKTVKMPDVEPGSKRGHFVVFGQVVGIYINDAYIKNGMVDTGAMRPIARMGYMDYAVVNPDTVFTLNRPVVADDGTVANPYAEKWDGTYR